MLFVNSPVGGIGLALAPLFGINYSVLSCQRFNHLYDLIGFVGVHLHAQAFGLFNVGNILDA